ncbi:hypothetical protein PsYK624_105820 [Phanerochaete sordida]|uniref:C2H2-type domain-containing protein n=1 Tax=Phanerochaete sordida TaxID=48140 RepID=A0A9P3GE55_9APHY|nr:hypothetical protein PsYK624_105820 [Phanerochaete sordida]
MQCFRGVSLWVKRRLAVLIFYRIVKNRQRPFKVPCPGCHYHFVKNEKSELMRHGYAHMPPRFRPFACPFPACGDTFAQEVQLKIHVNVHMSPAEKTYTYCGLTDASGVPCLEKFAHPTGASRHRKKVHPGRKPPRPPNLHGNKDVLQQAFSDYLAGGGWNEPFDGTLSDDFGPDGLGDSEPQIPVEYFPKIAFLLCRPEDALANVDSALLSEGRPAATLSSVQTRSTHASGGNDGGCVRQAPAPSPSASTSTSSSSDHSPLRTPSTYTDVFDFEGSPQTDVAPWSGPQETGYATDSCDRPLSSHRVPFATAPGPHVQYLDAASQSTASSVLVSQPPSPAMSQVPAMPWPNQQLPYQQPPHEQHQPPPQHYSGEQAYWPVFGGMGWAPSTSGVAAPLEGAMWPQQSDWPPPPLLYYAPADPYAHTWTPGYPPAQYYLGYPDQYSAEINAGPSAAANVGQHPDGATMLERPGQAVDRLIDQAAAAGHWFPQQHAGPLQAAPGMFGPPAQQTLHSSVGSPVQTDANVQSQVPMEQDARAHDDQAARPEEPHARVSNVYSLLNDTTHDCAPPHANPPVATPVSWLEKAPSLASDAATHVEGAQTLPHNSAQDGVSLHDQPDQGPERSCEVPAPASSPTPPPGRLPPLAPCTFDGPVTRVASPDPLPPPPPGMFRRIPEPPWGDNTSVTMDAEAEELDEPVDFDVDLDRRLAADEAKVATVLALMRQVREREPPRFKRSYNWRRLYAAAQAEQQEAADGTRHDADVDA